MHSHLHKNIDTLCIGRGRFYRCQHAGHLGFGARAGHVSANGAQQSDSAWRLRRLADPTFNQRRGALQSARWQSHTRGVGPNRGRSIGRRSGRHHKDGWRWVDIRFLWPCSQLARPRGLSCSRGVPLLGQPSSQGELVHHTHHDGQHTRAYCPTRALPQLTTRLFGVLPCCSVLPHFSILKNLESGEGIRLNILKNPS